MDKLIEGPAKVAADLNSKTIADQQAEIRRLEGEVHRLERLLAAK